MKNRLQIKYYMPTFPYTREDAIKFIEKVFSTDATINPNPRASLPAEPIAVFYGENALQSNVILAIGRYGDGLDYRNNAPYFLIDTANLSENLSKVEVNLEEVTKIANQAKTDIEQMKAEIKTAQDEISAIWSKIGVEADTAGHNTIFGYINDKIGMIMGGVPVDGLTSINEIGNAILKIRTRLKNIVNANNKLAERLTTLEGRTDNLYENYINWKEVVNTSINDINDKIGELPEELSVAQYIRNVEGALNTEIKNREDADNTVRLDFAAADDVILKKANEYADQSEIDAIATADKHADTKVADGITTANVYTDTAVSSAKDILRTEIAKTVVKSDNKTIIVDTPTSEGTNIRVNIDGVTIVKNDDGILSVASDKLVQYKGENSIVVSDNNSGSKTVSLKINENESVLVNDANGLSTNLSLKWVKATDGANVNEIQLLGKDNIVISRIDVAEFVKTGILTNVTLNTDDVENPKLIFEFDTEVGVEPIVLNVKDLVDVYTAGKGLELVGSEFSVKLSQDNENRFLSVSEDGLKLSGIVAEFERVDAVEANIVTINGRLDNLEKDSHIHNNKAAIDTITEDKLEAWSNSLSDAKVYADEKDVLVKTDVYNSLVSTVVTNVTPEDATSQTLIRKIIVDGKDPIFYVTNSSKDILHNGDSLYNVIELLKENNELKNKVETLEIKLAAFELAIENINNRIDNLDFDVDMEAIKTAVVPLAVEESKAVIVPIAVDESKKAIITSDVFKAVDGEIMVNVDTELGTITYGFDDDAIFMADYNVDEEDTTIPEEEEVEILS